MQLGEAVMGREEGQGQMGLGSDKEGAICVSFGLGA